MGSNCCEQGYRGAEQNTYDVITTATTATLAPYAAQIARDFGAQSYYWGVRFYSDRASVDDVVSEHPLDWECNASLKAPYGDCVYSEVGYPKFVSK